MQNYSVLKYKDQLLGPQTKLAVNNFIYSGERINPVMLSFYLQQKEASLRINHSLNFISENDFHAIQSAIQQLMLLFKGDDQHKSQLISEIFPVDPLQGGAGTSLNQNINEVIANLANFIVYESSGAIGRIHPNDHINLHQSTNDTFPSVFRAAAVFLLKRMQESFSDLQQTLQLKEKEFLPIEKLGRTQLQDAVPISLGNEFGAYAQAIGRDRWRFYNAEERLRNINLGGTVVGTGIGAPIKYRMLIAGEFAKITGLPLSKAEDTIDATQNLDSVIEAHAIIKTAACNLIKIANDLRLLSSGPRGGIGEINLPELQAGSTMIPGKINPVIPEHIIQIGEIVKANDLLIGNLGSAGNLELNQFYPAIAHHFLKSQSLMLQGANLFAKKCISGISVNIDSCRKHLEDSSAYAVCFAKIYGYDQINKIVKKSIQSNIPFRKVLQEELSLDDAAYNKIISGEE